MDEVSKRRKWRRWLSAIAVEVERLQREQVMFWQVREQVQHNVEWLGWVENLYLVGVSIAIRRLADANPRHRSLSLVKLLKDMEQHPECLSRQTTLRANPASRREEVHRLFDQLGGAGASHLPPTVLSQWREDFLRLAEPFRAWVDHRIAHHDLVMDSARPSIEEGAHVLESVAEIVGALRLLLGT